MAQACLGISVARAAPAGVCAVNYAAVRMTTRSVTAAAVAAASVIAGGVQQWLQPPAAAVGRELGQVSQHWPSVGELLTSVDVVPMPYKLVGLSGDETVELAPMLG